MRSMATERRMPVSLLMERILLVMTVLGLACLCVGVPLYLAGKISDAFTVAQVGVYVLLIGIALIAMRIFYWIMEELVGRGLESMGKTRSHIAFQIFRKAGNICIDLSLMRLKSIIDF